MKPIYLFENELPTEARDQVVNEQTTPEGKKKALEKLIQRDVFMEQELATSEEPLKIKDLLKMKETELKTQISIKEWALFNIGAWLYIITNLLIYQNAFDCQVCNALTHSKAYYIYV